MIYWPLCLYASLRAILLQLCSAAKKFCKQQRRHDMVESVQSSGDKVVASFGKATEKFGDKLAGAIGLHGD